jgi:eukaryotic-like serine/threonine-protein kinase
MNSFNPVGISLTPDATSTGSDDPRVIAALEEYLVRLNAGERPSRAEWLAQHSEIADALGRCLDGLLFVQTGARHLSGREPSQPAESRFHASTVLGDYRIVREVGRGGMGVVYEAEQISLRRRVALKVLPAAASFDPRQRQRFQVEAQSAGHLHHPHIVPVFGVGCDDEIPYYAMQFIEGQTLADLIEELRVADDPRSSATESATDSHRSFNYFRYVARLGVDAAEALDHAHGLGVIHRDVKPSNLMVDRLGHLWVTDFGLARFDGESELTRTGDVLGTLRYTSPEQAQAKRGVVDQRTDVYSLGATLYELVTLRPAFDGRDRQEILNQINRDETPSPRKTNPSIPRDLETIILKAMAHDLGSRYTTARELAEDLTRFLDARPVLARKPTALDRLRKWARRHRTAVTTATSALILGLTIGAILIGVEHRRTLQALSDLRLARLREQANMKLFFSTTDSLTMSAMGMLAMRSPTGEGDSTGFYRKALATYEQIAKLYHDDPEMKLVAAEAYRRIGFVQMILRYYHQRPDFQQADADGSYRSALALCESSDAEPSHLLEARQLQAAILDDYGEMLVRLGRVVEAQKLFQQSLDERSRLVRLFPGKSEHATDLNKRRSELGRFYTMMGRPGDAESLFREVLKASSNQPEARNDLAWFLASDPTTSSAGRAEAVALARLAVALEPRERTFRHTLGLALFRAGQGKEAEEVVNQALQGRPAEADSLIILALIHAERGELDQARARLDAAAAWTKANGVQDPILHRLTEEVARLLKPKD